MIKNFFERKMFYDPYGFFASSWSADYMSKVAPNLMAHPKNHPNKMGNQITGQIDTSFEIPIVSQHRDDSYRKLMRNRIQRNEFMEQFFSIILNVESKNKMKSLIAKAVADPRNKNDDEIFQSLKANLDKDSGDIPSTLLKTIKGMY